MWINDQETDTPTIVTVTRGEPKRATVKSVGIDGTLVLTFDDGTEQRVPTDLCTLDRA
jgi:hypothetical protein